MICAIHQPNLVPWYPFFQKMQSADVFVFLTHCQFEKNGYQNRFSMDGRWHTLSIFRGLQEISEKKYTDPHRDWAAIKRALPAYCGILDSLDDCISESLVSTNTEVIRRLAARLGVSTRIESDFPTEKRSTERLVEICERYDCDVYLSGPSGSKYLDTELFEDRGVRVTFQNPADTLPVPTLERLR